MKKNLKCLIFSFIFVIAFVSGWGVLFNSIQSHSFTSSNLSTAVRVGEIWNDTVKKFDRINLNKLMQFVTGNNTVTTTNLATLKTQATNKKTSASMRAVSVTSSDGSVKAANKDIIVTLGGLDWTPVYLSNDTSSNPILTLFLTDSEQLFGKKYYTSNTVYSAFNASASVPFNTGFSASNTPTSTYPDNMYGMSAIRATVLNNGGTYSTGTGGRSTASMTKKSDSIFSKYTVTTSNNTAIADFMVLPTNVSWQKSGQDARTLISSTYKFSSEDLQTSQSSTGFYNSSFNYSSKSNYTQWGNDRLWLPSYSEIGYNGTNGIWRTSYEQRTCKEWMWLRSAFENDATVGHMATGMERIENGQYVEDNSSVRPALHLNLNLASANSYGATNISTCVVSNLSNSQWNPVSNPIPTFTLKTSDGKTTLVKNTDYTVTSSSTSAPGTITLTIKAKGSNYEGTKTVTYQLQKRSITRALRDNSLTVSNQTWKGSAITPTFSGLKDYAYNADTGGSKLSTTGIALTQNTHYTLSYTNNTNIGTATITITGKGNYIGTKTVNFRIVAVNMSLITVDAIADRVWNPVSNPIPTITARYTGANKTLTTADYTITSSAKTDGTAVPGKVTLTITGKGNYTGTKTVTYNLNRRDIGLALKNNSLNIANQTYTGERLEPTLTGLKDYAYETLTSTTALSSAGVPLTLNTHYVLNYADNIDVGTATVTITGNGVYYTGTTTTAFTIVARSIANGTLGLNITDIDYKFDEDLQSNLIATLEVNNKTLTSRDYDLSYYSPSGSIVTQIINAGTYKIRATGKGNYSSTKEVNFVVNKIALREEFFTINPSSYEYRNAQIIPSFTASYDYETGKNYTFKTSDYIATFGDNIDVSTGGSVTFTGSGSNFEGTVIKNFIITAKSISAGDISKSNIPTQTYTGSEISPNFTLTDTTLGRNLILNTDYTITITNNVNVGNATIKIVGKGNYAGETAIQFEITPKNINLVNIAEIPDQPYTGKEIEPVLNITDNGLVLKKGTHYTVTFANNITVTNSSVKASATIVGTGNYEGTITVYFNVVPFNISGAIFNLGKPLISPYNYEEDFLSEIQEDATLKVNTLTLEKNVDYKIIALNEDKTAEINNITNIGKYVIRATGFGNFEGINEVVFEVTQRDISQSDIEIELDSTNNDFTYNGETHEATIKVFGNYTIKGVNKRAELIENRDYTISYDENINASTSARVLITGIGNFTSVKTKNFTIKPKMLDGLDIVLENDIPNQNYTGTTLSPTFVLKDNSLNQILVRGTHYSATYTNNTNAGEATISLTGISNYGGTKILHFNILPRDISVATILEIPDQNYVGVTIEPTLTVTDNGRNLVRGIDYLATFKNNINVGPAGSAQIIINGINNYQGKKETSFTILPADFADATLHLNPSTTIYTGKGALTSISVVMNGNNAVVPDSNYEVTYLRGGQVLNGPEDMVDVGTYTIRVKGIVNYEGTIQQSFVITPFNLQDVTVLLSSSSFVYNQSSQTPVVTLSYNGLTLTSGTDYILTYRQTNESGATVTHPTDVGTYAIILEGKGNYQKTNSSLSFEITPASLNKGAVATFSSDPATANITFDNSTHKIILSSLKINNVEFFNGFEGEYLNISYLRGNEETTDFINAGTITIKISSIETNPNVIGEKTYTYEIKRKNLATSDANNQLLVTGIENKVYTRNAHTQNVVINDTVADYALTSNDFSVTYSTSCINAEEDIVIYINSNASGNYSGTIIRTFNIEKANVNYFVLLSTGAVYSARAQLIESEVKAGDIVLNPSEYKLVYKRDNVVTEDITNIGDIEVNISIVSSNFKIETSLPSQNFAIYKINIEGVTLTHNIVGFNGETYSIEISSVVGEGGVVLKTTDYSVSYSDKDNNALLNNQVLKAGVYTVKVTGVGNAQGSKTTTFTITPRELTSGVINYYKTDEKLNFLLDEEGNKIKIDIETNYRGQYVLPEIQLVLVKDPITLVRSTDGGAANPNGDFIFAIYSLKEGEEDKNLLGAGSYLTVGEYNFVITGINNYTGTISKTYKVNLADFSNKNIRIDFNVQKAYQGEPVTFQFASTQGESAEAKVYFVQEDFEDEELILGKTFQLFSGYIKITLNGNNDITKAEISSKEAYDTLNEGSNDDGTTWSILFVNNGYVNNNSVGTGTLVIQGMEDSPFTTNTIVAKQFGISKVILSGDNTTVTGFLDSYTYTGAEVIGADDIEVTVTYKPSINQTLTHKLVYGTDYELIFNDNVNAGNVNVTIKGINTFDGTLVLNNLFVIKQKDISVEIDDEKLFTISPDTVYTKGVEQKPEITASYNSKEMVLGVDYTVTYKRKGEETTNFTNAGEIVLEFVGIGNFTGSITKTYRINQLVISDIIINKTSEYFTGGDIVSSLTITVKDILGNDVIKEDGTEYYFVYTRNGEETTNFSDAGVIIIRVATSEDSNYTVAGEEVSTIFTINKVQLSATTPVISSEEYTGTSIQPNFDLTLGEGEGAYTLNANEYEIKGYRNNINVSKADNKAVILLQATNKNFEGTKEVEFEITAKDISNGVLGFGDGEYQSKFTYNGSNQTPNFSLTYLTNKLVLDTDYTITITRTNGVADASLPYKNVGEFSVEISGIGNYKGTVTVNYEIEALSLSLKDLLVEVTFSETSFEFTGSSIEPTITSVKVNFNGAQLSLNEGTDYTLEYSNNLNAGNATMTLKGNGNFADSATKSFEILRKRLTNDMVKSIASHSYNKEQIQLSLKDITFEYHSYEFTNDDFEISYLRNPRNVGTYVITISGKGNFSGSIEASFEITPISLEDAVITFTNEYFTINECTFTGSSLRRILIDSLIVYIGDVKLDSNDYGITFADPSARYLIDVGTKNFTLVENGSKNIIGSKAGSFIVSPKLLENFMLEVSKDELVYTGEEIKPRFTLTYNGVALVENTDYDIEYYDNTLATSSASFTIKGKNNYSGSLSYDFVIKKATPTVELKKDIEVPFFVGDKLTPESIKPYLDFSTEGIIDFTPINSLKLGGNTITYTFIPNDNLNYERIKGTIEPRAVYNVKVTFGVENNSKDVIASASTQIPVQVEVIINGETFALDKSRYSVVITLLDKDVTVNDFSNAGNYEIRIRLNSGDEENYYFQTPNSVRFYAKTKTIFVENTPFFAVNEDYFEEGISLVIETYRLKTEIINAIGSKNYESVQNVSKVYKVVGFFKNGVKLEGEELEKLKDVKIYFKAANYEYFVLLNDYLQTANGDVGNIQLEIGSFLIETMPSNSVFIIIICVVLALIVLIIIILLILKFIKNRKIKKASQGTVDIEKLNSIANSANMARNNNQNTMQNSYANNQNLQGINIPSQTQIIQNPNAINNNINSNGIMQQNISQNNNVNNAINQSINPNQNGMVNSPINNAGEVNTNLNNQNNQSTPINPSNLINNKAKPTTTRKPNKPNNK